MTNTVKSGARALVAAVVAFTLAGCTPEQNAQIIIDAALDAGLSPYGAIDMVGIAACESGLKDGAVSWGHTNYGLFQMGEGAWNEARRFRPDLPPWSPSNALNPIANATAAATLIAHIGDSPWHSPAPYTVCNTDPYILRLDRLHAKNHPESATELTCACNAALRAAGYGGVLTSNQCYNPVVPRDC